MRKVDNVAYYSIYRARVVKWGRPFSHAHRAYVTASPRLHGRTRDQRERCRGAAVFREVSSAVMCVCV